LKTLGNLLNALLNILSFGYLAVVLVLLVLRLVLGETIGAVVAFNSLLPALLIPAFLWFVMGLLLRRFLMVGLSLPIMALFLVWYGPYFMPRSQSPAPDERVVSVMTYNALLGAQGADEIAQLMRFKNTDFVVLQELRDARQLPSLTQSVADEYPYFVAISDQGLYSKHPLDTGEMEATMEANQAADLLRVVATIDGQPVTVMVFHPGPPAGWPLPTDATWRNQGYEQLLATLAAEEEGQPVIVAGDFNATDRSDAYWQVRDAGYIDVYQDVAWGLGLTFPQFTEMNTSVPWLDYPAWFPPIVRIDYVMHNGERLRSLTAESVYTGGSDHFPVVATMGLRLDPPEEPQSEMTERGQATAGEDASDAE
jgi:endonuclease/exonuclease/phosphatase (EEP) superfamily protein YafD